MRALQWLGVAVLTSIGFTASADCRTDTTGDAYCGRGSCIAARNGVIWCSRFFQGGAHRTRDGKVVCGKGQCEKSSRGEIYCSSVTGGAVLKDSKGLVRCTGQCERGSSAYCEHTRADSAG